MAGIKQIGATKITDRCQIYAGRSLTPQQVLNLVAPFSQQRPTTPLCYCISVDRLTDSTLRSQDSFTMMRPGPQLAICFMSLHADIEPPDTYPDSDLEILRLATGTKRRSGAIHVT